VSESSGLVDRIRKVLSSEDASVMDLIDVLDESCKFIEGCGEPASEPKLSPSKDAPSTTSPCPSCLKPPVVVQEFGTPNVWWVGCHDVFFHPRHGEEPCRNRFMVVSPESREQAIANWVEMIERNQQKEPK
jgi:hypothetical protein